MKAARVLLPVLLLLLVGLSPGTALAADSDFEVEFRSVPMELGPNGGDADIRLVVRNLGATDITWFDVVVSSRAGFSQHYDIRIRPGDALLVALLVPLGAEDLDRTLFVQVSMNNNSSVNPDGVKTSRFFVHTLDPVLTVNATVSPHRASYEVGDTVTVEYRYSPHSTAGSIQVRNNITISAGSHVRERLEQEVSVPSGEPQTESFRYTFDEDDVGDLSIVHYATSAFAGESYVATGSVSLAVEAPEPEFTAVLAASPAVITAGDPVTTRVRITNESDHTTNFVIYDTSRVRRGAIDNVPAGAVREFVEEIHPSASGDISYIVKGKIGSEADEKTTNAVAITVNPVTTSASSTTSSEPRTTTSLEVTTTVTDAGTTTSAKVPPEAAAVQKTGGLSDTWIIVIIAAVAVVAIATVVTTGIMIIKKRGQV